MVTWYIGSINIIISGSGYIKLKMDFFTKG